MGDTNNNHSSNEKTTTTRGALEEVVERWKTLCCGNNNDADNTTSSKTLDQQQEELYQDAKTFFHYLTSNTEIQILNVKTKSSHEPALAILIRDLGPAFSSRSHRHRILALNVLGGAIHGCCCCCSASSDNNNNVQLSPHMMELLGNFLLGHCHPIQEEEDDDNDNDKDYDALIRDASIKALSWLVKIPTSFIEPENKSNNNENDYNPLALRMSLAMQGVEKRCATAANDDNDTDPFYQQGQHHHNSIQGGLSTLPRSKRAMCFTLLQNAIHGIGLSSTTGTTDTTGTVTPEIQEKMVEFAQFCATCLQGESDPRCLQQLFLLLHSLLVTLEPWFTNTTATTTNAPLFPISDVFDAVAPYYPIQFTPPPNDIHGITREGLHNGLLSVLTFCKLDNAQPSPNSKMLNLSAGLFLESLIPILGDDDPPSALEKLEALECLWTLLFDDGNRCADLELSLVKTLQEALKATHDEASSLAVQEDDGPMSDRNKTLADFCRTFVSKVAFSLETIGAEPKWDVFVSQPLEGQIRKLRLSPSHSKTSIAYIACLTASGGPRTLRTCLAKGLEPLLEYVKENLSVEDSEDLAAAAHGIAALLSSCRVAMERSQAEGIILHPHPLDPYASQTCDLLLQALETTTTTTTGDGIDTKQPLLSFATRAGFTRALECFLLVSTSPQIDHTPAQFPRLVSCLEQWMETVISSEEEEESDLAEVFQDACCRALGTILGQWLTTKDKEQEKSDETTSTEEKALSPCGVVFHESIQDCIRNEIYPSIMASAIQKETTATPGMERKDRKCLSDATACGNSDVADRIMTSLLEKLNQSLATVSNTQEGGSLACAQALSYVLQHGGHEAIRAFHRNTTAVQSVLETLSKSQSAEYTKQVRSSIANLALPATNEEKQALENELHAVQAIADCLVPAYHSFVPNERLLQLAKQVSDIVPPLSEADNFSLAVRLPILGAALSNDVPNDDSLREIATSMLSGLTEYVLNTDYDARARSAAALTLHAAITHAGTDSKNECPVMPLVRDVINPQLSSATTVAELRDCLNILALVSSAAALRGKSSASTAHKGAEFLVKLAVNGKSPLPFSPDGNVIYDGTSLKKEDMHPSLGFMAASAYGSILSTDLKPITRQRLTHICLGYIRVAYEERRNQTISGQNAQAPPVGLVGVACHVVCYNDLSKFDRGTLHQIATLATEGLSSELFVAKTPGSKVIASTKEKNLVLAAVLKTICAAPHVVTGFLLTIVTGLLRAYAVSDTESEISCKLLALQALQGAAHMGEAARSSVTSIKPAVVAVLAAATNHPSGMLRQAAVEVRNAWYLVD